MNTSRPASNGKPRWYRRGHRWLGASIVAFVLFIAITGITLNHGDGLGLNQRYVNWSWLLDAYGVNAPEPSASFADGGHRATLLGERLFVDAQDSGQTTASLAGIVVAGPLVVVGGSETVFLFMTDVALVEAIDLATELSAPIERVGVTPGGRVVIDSNGTLYLSDADVATFAPWTGGTVVEVRWSAKARPDDAELSALEAAYRGRGLTVERLLLDLHSGRILAMPGTLLLDIIGIGMILLSLSGIALARARNRRENGLKKRNGGD